MGFKRTDFDVNAVFKADKELSTDIVVVGAGMSGLCAAVQASSSGAGVIVLEINHFVGGNGLMVEGVFAANSKMQKEQGIDIKFKDLFAKEASFFNYRIDPAFWKDLYNRSAENVDWLIENGVEFTGVVDKYMGFGHIPVFHWFAGNKRGQQYAKALKEKAEAQNAVFLTDTRGRQLIMEDGKVAGIYAMQKDGTCLKITCKAVILASGGYAENLDMLVERGKKADRIEYTGGPGHLGDGLNMAKAVGAKDISKKCSYLFGTGVKGLAALGETTLFFILCESPAMWVNQDAVRFAREDCALEANACQHNAIELQKETYSVIEQNALDAMDAKHPGLKAAIIKDAERLNGDTVAICDTIEECAEAMGLDPQTLKATLEQYNGFCESGDDEEFGKTLDFMVPLTKPPYYIFHHNMTFMTSIGGIHTNVKMEVLTEEEKPIPGLFAAGTDSCELYRETYTISVPASCGANNVNSGRVAAKSAVAYVK